MPRIAAAASAVLAVALLVLAADPATRSGAANGSWWKGNTHTHTLWSDGNAPPELVVEWYVERDYDFLVLSDHNVLLRGERWLRVGPPEEGGRITEEHLARVAERMGADRVEQRESDGVLEVRLRTLAELRESYERPGELLLIEGEEVTDAFQGLPVHTNAVNVAELLQPQGGTSVASTAQNDLDAIAEQARALERPILAHINHPNFGWAFRADDLASLAGARFLEVYNGHQAARNRGDDAHPSTEALWDHALTERLFALGLGTLYGVATDDAHDFFDVGIGKSNPGRGWVMVRAAELTPEALLAAMEAGDFYATSGVLLRDVRADDEQYLISIDSQPDVTYETRFYGARLRGDGTPGSPGALLSATDANPAVYECRGNELYVRAVVTSSRPHPNPSEPGEFETAWLQPHVPHRD